MSEHAIANAQGWLANILSQVAALKAAEDARDDEKAEELREAMQGEPLSVMVRDGWRSPGVAVSEGGAEEYEILLSTGGPALRIYGQLGKFSQPDEWPRLQWQDWGTPWTDYPLGAEREALQTYACLFYFGE